MNDTIRTTLMDAALAGVTDDADVTDAVAAVAPDATLAACRANDPLLDFDEWMGVVDDLASDIEHTIRTEVDA
jgi:hypothetical protein